jgi:phosphatidylinositol alpha 1,6-mannosyltransferase
VRIATTSAAALRRRIDEFQPDVIHLASPMILGGRAVVAAQKAGVPTVAVYHTDIPGYTARYGMPFLESATWQLLRDVHQRATVNLAPSIATRDQLIHHGIERVDLWRRGVDTSLFSSALRSPELRARYARPDEKLVVYVGRLAAEKQVEALRVVQNLPGVRLVIVGDGPEREHLQQVLPEAHFTGLLRGAELSRAMAGLDVFVHPGELETFGQTLQEAHASGVPVVAPAAGGPLDIVRHSHDGWLYPPGDHEALRARVVDLVGDERKRRAFGTSARERAEGRTWHDICSELMGHYEDAVRVHARAGSAEV